MNERAKWVRLQRIVLHVALLAVFLMGFIKEGETALSQGIGVLSALAVVASLVMWWRKRKARGGMAVA